MEWIITLNSSDKFTDLPTNVRLNSDLYEVALIKYKIDDIKRFYKNPIYCLSDSVELQYCQTEWKPCISVILPKNKGYNCETILFPIYISFTSYVNDFSFELTNSSIEGGVCVFHIRKKLSGN